VKFTVEFPNLDLSVTLAVRRNYPPTVILTDLPHWPTCWSPTRLRQRYGEAGDPLRMGGVEAEPDVLAGRSALDLDFAHVKEGDCKVTCDHSGKQATRDL
jgi:hypothetical protein